MCTHNSRPALTIVKVYFKSGFVRTLPFRTPAPSVSRSCAEHPAGRFLGWFRRMKAAQPGFPTMIRSIFMRTDAPPCDDCRAALMRVLSRYRLADRLRYVEQPAHSATCSCGCRAKGLNGSRPAAVWFDDDDPFGDALFKIGADGEIGRNPAGALSEKERDRQRRVARQQTDERDFARTRHRHTDHGIPLAQAHLDPATKRNPNRNNLRFVTRRVHQAKEKMWNAYVMHTFFQRCTTPEERRRKLTEIYAELRKQYPKDMISHAFGKELELLEIHLP